MKTAKEEEEKSSLLNYLKQNGLEIIGPFLLAGFGMVLAGLLLDHVQHWRVFKQVPELFILVPALLGRNALHSQIIIFC